jgi:hypothetical protein
MRFTRLFASDEAVASRRCVWLRRPSRSQAQGLHVELLTEHPFDFVITAAEFNGEEFDRACEFPARQSFHRREVPPDRQSSGVLLDEDEFQPRFRKRLVAKSQ